MLVKSLELLVARDGCVRTFDAKTGRLQRLMEGHNGKVRGIRDLLGVRES